MRHKHADMIIEWAKTGKSVQFYNDNEWEDIDKPAWIDTLEYRFKPEVLRYKRYIFNVGRGNELGVIIPSDMPMQEDNEVFVKWIDTEWQEVEV